MLIITCICCFKSWLPSTNKSKGSRKSRKPTLKTHSMEALETSLVSDMDVLQISVGLPPRDPLEPISATDSAFGVEELERIDLIKKLPTELAIKILSYIPFKNIVTVSLVSKHWSLLVNDNRVWNALYLRLFDLSGYQRSTWYLPREWKAVLKCRLLLLDNWRNGIVSSTVFEGHNDSVYCIQHTHSTIVSGSRDRKIKFWDIESKQCIRTLSGHTGSVLCLQFDDELIVSGSSDCTIVVWDFKTGEKKQSFLGHSSPVLDVRFNKSVVVSCSKDNTVKVWSLEMGVLLRSLQGHKAAVNSIFLHGNLLVSASGDTTIKLWNIETGELLRNFGGHTRGLACVQFDGDIIASGANDRTIKLWNAHSGELIRTLVGHNDLVRTLCFNKEHLVSGGYDHTIKVWDMKTGNLLCTLTDAHASWVFHVQLDSSRIFSASQVLFY